MPKPVLAVDIDEVLFPFLPELVKYYNRKYQTSLRVEDHTVYRFAGIWGMSLEEVTRHIELFTRLDHRPVEPIEGASQVLARLKQRYRLVIVTSREEQFEQPTRQWLEHHFAGYFEEVVFVGNQHSGRAFRNKVELCRELGAQMLIDDSLAYVTECAGQGIPALLFGDYPWNQAEELPAGVRRVRDWAEAERAL